MSQDPFGDVPLFRELQRLLTSSHGPVNMEIAQQVAGAVAAGAGTEPGIEKGLGSAYGAAVITAQQLLSGYTRLVVDELPRTEVIGRSAWIEKTLKGWAWLIEDFAGRFTNMAPGSGEEGAGGAMGAEAVMAQVVPLLMGLQVGTLVGHLATEALHRYELPIPRDDEGHLFLVASNAEQVIKDYDFDRDAFVSWIALRDTGRHMILAAHPWVNRYFRSALSEVVESIEIDTGDIERRMMELQTKGMEGLQDFDAENVLPVVQTPRHRAALDRLRAFFSVFEGYASHASHKVAAQIIPTAARIEEGMARFAASPSEGKQALASVLGVSLDRQVTESGTTFCAAVVKLRGIDALNQVWAAPDNLPSLAEIRDPFAWMERVLDA